MEQEEAGMKYIDGKLYQLIEQFEELGDFDNKRQAQRTLAEQIEEMPLKKILPEKEENKEKTSRQLLKI